MWQCLCTSMSVCPNTCVCIKYLCMFQLVSTRYVCTCFSVCTESRAERGSVFSTCRQS
jgi:hypothetical protein